MLNKEQINVNKILKSGKNVFLTGRAGTGKTFLLNHYIEECKNEGKNVLVTAPTGIAALNLDGITLHSAFTIPIPAYGHYDFEIKPSQIKTALSADVIIIDEISMCRADVFEYFYFCMKLVKEKNGKMPQIIVCGDFYQLPPVVSKDDVSKLKRLAFDESGFCFTSIYWKEFKFKCIELKTIVRQGDKKFIEELDKLRRGDVSCLDYFNKHVNPSANVDGVYICSTNAKADLINTACLDRIDGTTFAYKSIRTGFCAKEYTVDDNIYLKEGAKIVLMTNDVINNKYQNGSMGTVKKCFDDYILVALDNNEDVFVSKHTWNTNKITVSNGMTNKKSIGSFSQLPVKLAYAVTMHKTQGQTYDNIFVSPESFADGQLYVAISRVKSPEGLFLDAPIEESFILTSEKVNKFYENFEYVVEDSIVKKKKEIYKKALSKFKEKSKKKTSKTKSKTKKSSSKKASAKKTTVKKSTTKSTKKTAVKKTSNKTKKKSTKKTTTRKKGTKK